MTSLIFVALLTIAAHEPQQVYDCPTGFCPTVPVTVTANNFAPLQAYTAVNFELPAIRVDYQPTRVEFLPTVFNSAVSYGSVGSLAVPTTSSFVAPSNSFFSYRANPRRTTYRQRWTVAGGNANLFNHLAGAPHYFNASGLTQCQALAWHDQHHDQIGPVSFSNGGRSWGRFNFLDGVYGDDQPFYTLTTRRAGQPIRNLIRAVVAARQLRGYLQRY